MGIFAQVTLPDVGLDIVDFVAAAGVSLGAVVAVVMGWSSAFLLIRKGVWWYRVMTDSDFREEFIDYDGMSYESGGELTRRPRWWNGD